MSPLPRSSRWVGLGFLVGLAAFVAVTASQGIDTLVETLAVAGWRIVLLVPIFGGPLAAATGAWWVLLRADARPPPTSLLLARWIGFAVNQLLPVARIGGEVARARLAVRAGAPGAAVAASVIADKTAQVASVAVFAVVGLAALAARSLAPDLVGWGLAGAGLVAGAGAAFYFSQRRGGLKLAGRWLSLLLPESSRDDWRASFHRAQDELEQTYRGAGFWLSVAGHVLFRLGLTLEVWVALDFLGHPVTWLDALILEAVNQALRAATFMIPGALGAQETGFLVLGSVLGVPAPVALSVSLVKRARELMIGLPALACWSVLEGRSAASGRRTGQRG